MKSNKKTPVAAALTALVLLLLLAPTASAKEVISYFGTEVGSGSLGGEFKFIGDIAVNSTGAGPASRGDIYVADPGNHRIQRFAQNDNGTPANPYDDTFPFLAAWGVGVDSASSGGGGYEICTVATACKTGARSGGNGSVTGNGALVSITGLAVDQDTGDLYVADSESGGRISVYDGEGTFLRSFGWDVVESGPDNNGTGYEVCVGGAGDICKTGTAGAGIGQLSPGLPGIAISPADGSSGTGEVYVADRENHRVATYNLDGTSPSSFGISGLGPEEVAVDSRGIVYTQGLASLASGWEVDRFDTQNANGGGVGPLAPIKMPVLATGAGKAGHQLAGLEVHPDSDGAGPDGDTLYVLRNLGEEPESVVQQFGPVNAPGLTAPPSTDDARHGSAVGFNYVNSLGFDDSNGRLFVGDLYNVGSAFSGLSGPGAKTGVYVLDKAGGPPSASLNSLSDVTATGVTVHGSVNPNGPPNVTYRLEYSTDGVKWEKTAETQVGGQETPQQVDAVLSPGAGLQPNTFYHVRLVATKAFTAPVVTAEKTFATLAAAPIAETTGSPLRTATTVQFSGRVTPRNSPTTYHFEYGDQGPCNANPCTSTSDQPAGSGAFTELVAESVGSLKAGATYHYRVVTDNGNPGSPAYGEDMTVTTRTSDAPLSHGHFPGPPGSDRAYELVSPADTSGNPIWSTSGMSSDGNRSTYGIAGGIPGSETGSFASLYISERAASGWQVKNVMPPRSELVGSGMTLHGAAPDFSSLALFNFNDATHESTVWKLSPTAAPVKLNAIIPPQESGFLGGVSASKDPFRIFQMLRGGSGFDLSYPEAAGYENLYEITSGTPRLVSILPDGSVPPCGVSSQESGGENFTPDGSHVFFRSGTPSPCPSPGNGFPNSQQYVRDLDTGTTTLLPGWERFLTTTNEVAYFSTKQRLVPEDTPPATSELGGDVYRYDLESGDLKCLTCGAVPGLDVNVEGAAVADDGSRISFSSLSSQPLVPGAIPSAGGNSSYVLKVKTGELHWIGPVRAEGSGSAITFNSASPDLNAQGGLDNGGVTQIYRYDDEDRSLVCVSCPQDGSPATAPTSEGIVAKSEGKDVAFDSTAALVPGDQNTASPGQAAAAGTDVYEWRDGRLLLVTDGLSNWPNEGGVYPRTVGFSDDGRDLEFTASARYTPDALDSYLRLYDARIGGGFEFPAAPKPCPLEVCQGTPKGAPEEATPGTGSFAGPGNLKQGAKAKKKHKKAHKKHPRKHRANHKRRASR